VEPVLRREKNRGYREEVFENRVAYAGMEQRYRCRLIDLDVLSSRRRVSCALFISDILSCKLDCPIILSSLTPELLPASVAHALSFSRESF
jgi:hypothetical protein